MVIGCVFLGGVGGCIFLAVSTFFISGINLVNVLLLRKIFLYVKRIFRFGLLGLRRVILKVFGIIVLNLMMFVIS